MIINGYFENSKESSKFLIIFFMLFVLQAVLLPSLEAIQELL